MIPDSMLRGAAEKSCEIYVSRLEAGYDPKAQHKFSPEFEKKIKKLRISFTAAYHIDHPCLPDRLRRMVHC